MSCTADETKWAVYANMGMFETVLPFTYEQPQFKAPETEVFCNQGELFPELWFHQLDVDKLTGKPWTTSIFSSAL